MYRFLLVFALASACSSEKDGPLDTGDLDTGNPDVGPGDTGDTEDPVDTGDTQDTDTEDTDTEDTDTEPPPLLIEEGTWGLNSPSLVSDSCGVDSYQDVKEFVPSEISIAASTEESFNIDSATVCTRTDLDFTCTAQDVSEEALAGTAELTINSVMSGTIIDESNIDITFDVTIESCDGIGCLAIEAVLKFPCPVTLTTDASPL